MIIQQGERAGSNKKHEKIGMWKSNFISKEQANIVLLGPTEQYGRIFSMKQQRTGTSHEGWATHTPSCLLILVENQARLGKSSFIPRKETAWLFQSSV